MNDPRARGLKSQQAPFGMPPHPTGAAFPKRMQGDLLCGRIRGEPPIVREVKGTRLGSLIKAKKRLSRTTAKHECDRKRGKTKFNGKGVVPPCCIVAKGGNLRSSIKKKT